MRFFKCDHCGNIIVFLESKGVPVMCCGQKMTELVPGSVDAAAEKHVPFVTVEGDCVKVKVGEVLHPATEAHHIDWIVLETAHGFVKRDLDPLSSPEAVFALTGEKPVAVYAYCNLHGLWVKEF